MGTRPGINTGNPYRKDERGVKMENGNKTFSDFTGGASIFVLLNRTNLSFDLNGNVTQMIDPVNRTFTYQYAANKCPSDPTRGGLRLDFVV